MAVDILEIRRMFGQRLVGKPTMKKYVCEVVGIFPDKIIKYVTRHVWFLASLSDAWAFTFTGADIKDAHLIFLSDELFEQEDEDIRYTIAHEIGHVILGHKNSVHFEQTQSDIKRQEREADIFAKKYLAYNSSHE